MEPLVLHRKIFARSPDLPVPAAETARLKAEIDLAAYVRGRGIALSPRGKALVGRCPWHEDQSPSLFITPSRGLFHCFVCGIGGDVIRFVERLDNVSFPDAVRILAENSPGSFPHPLALRVMNTNTEYDPAALLDPENQRVLRYVIEYYTKTLERTPSALRYLESRGLIHPELVSAFQIGYADGSLLSAVPAYPSKEGIEMRRRLTACGMLRHKNNLYREHMKGRIVVPVTDADGVIRQMYGRAVHQTSNIAHLYLPFPKECVFNPRAFISETLIICESIFDALSFWVTDVRNVTCTYSATDIPPAFMDTVEKGNVRRVIIAFDTDDAGQRGAEKLAALLADIGVETSRMIPGVRG